MTTEHAPPPARGSSPWKWLLAIVVLVALLAFGVMLSTDPARNVVLETARVSTDPMGQRVLTGTVRNATSDRTYERVRVDVELIAAGDSVVGTMSAATANLAPGDSWRFTIPAPQKDVVRFRLAKLTCESRGSTSARLCSIGRARLVE